MRANLGGWVGIIEAAYRPASDEHAWIEGVVAAARPSLDDGLGVAAYAYEYHLGGAPLLTMRPLIESGIHPGTRDGVEEVVGRASQRLIFQSLTSAPVATLSQLTRRLPRDRQRIEARAEQLGFRDMIGVSAGDPAGTGLVLAAPRRRVQPMPRGAAVAWGRIAAHLAAGLRLQRLTGLVPCEDRFGDAEAILDPRGRVQHATPPAQPRPCRAALREAALGLQRARELRQSDPAEAVAAWRALVAGRWSLVDSFDHDGRRFLVARRNVPATRALAGLTLREQQVVGYACLGHSNKLIAYELGVSPSTVAKHLARSADKLGAASRAALIRICSALWEAQPPAAPRERP